MTNLNLNPNIVTLTYRPNYIALSVQVIGHCISAKCRSMGPTSLLYMFRRVGQGAVLSPFRVIGLHSMMEDWIKWSFLSLTIQNI